MQVIDSHIHCGVQNVDWSFSVIMDLLDKAGISGACMFAPVEDIYYRYTRQFDDNITWRQCREKAHAYLLDKARTRTRVYPYYFVWNDFKVSDLNAPFFGIKWHHHAGEPPYHYAAPECRAMIQAICQKNLPVVLEETFETTLEFIDRIDRKTVVIIPHLGMLNGGFDRLFAAGVWEADNIYADTALAGPSEIRAFLKRYGQSRLLFGSDYPFGDPAQQLAMIRGLDLPAPQLKAICRENIQRLIQG